MNQPPTPAFTCTVMIDLKSELTRPGHQFKAVLNDNGILVFSGSIQHNTVKSPGINYEHDHKGNALAAMIYNGKMEIRGHSGFTEGRVRTILIRLRQSPELRPLVGLAITYRGKAMGNF